MTSETRDQDLSQEPSLPLPPAITSDTPGTWAYNTMSVRVRDIARRTLSENTFPAEISTSVKQLIAEIPDQPLRPLKQAAPDAADWAAYLQSHLGSSWLTPPWFLTETYFYRRLIEATGFYGPGPGQGVDPFLYQKQKGIRATSDSTAAIAALLQNWISDGREDEHLAALLAVDLWGNRADLSMWPADVSGDQPMHVDWQEARAFTLADDTAEAVRHLNSRPAARVDFIVDNAGLELIADLALGDYLLSTSTAERLVLHLKPHPTFVSDAMIKDVLATAQYLAEQENKAVSAFGARIIAHLAAGRMVLKDDPFWVSPLAFWEMPPRLRKELGRSDLIISKGDANYRRLLGDRHWPFTSPFAAILSYTPAPVLALRALKAELASGLSDEQVERLNREDPEWLVNGRWGVLQFAVPRQP